jgi:hypothetical protein
VTPATLAFAAAGATALAALQIYESRKVKRQRAAFFTDCMDLFPACKVVQTNFDYPVLEGMFQGQKIRLEPLVDSVVPRKLPSLWLKVTLIAPVRYPGVFDLLRRPQGTEFYSPAGTLDHRVAMPEGWPQDSQIATDAPALMPPMEILAPHIGIFEDPRAKEMLITKGGVRIVYQVSQGERARYAVLRQAVFPENRLRMDLARLLLRTVTDLHKAVAA